MKQVPTPLTQRAIARDTSKTATKFDGKKHAFSFPRSGESGTEPRNFVEARKHGPGILTRDLPTSQTDDKK